MGIGLLALAALALAPPAPGVNDGHPAWSPDGRFIAFDRTRQLAAGYSNTSIYVARSDGLSARPITPTSAPVDALEPVWSPDGAWIAFEVGTKYLPPGVEWALRDGRRANAPSAGGDSSNTATSPTWSPDGRRLAIAARFGAGSGLYVVQRSSGWARRVVAGDVRFAAWSPDGRRIAFADSLSVALVPPAGGPVTRLAAPPARIAWSRDGHRLAFATGCSVGFVDRDATGLPPQRMPCSPEIETSTPSWSPDGKWFAYSACRRPVCSVFVTPAAPRGHGLEIPEARDPAWSPNGRTIAYTRVVGHAPGRVWLIRPDGTHAHPLLQGGR